MSDRTCWHGQGSAWGLPRSARCRHGHADRQPPQPHGGSHSRAVRWHCQVRRGESSQDHYTELTPRQRDQTRSHTLPRYRRRAAHANEQTVPAVSGNVPVGTSRGCPLLYIAGSFAFD